MIKLYVDNECEYMDYDIDMFMDMDDFAIFGNRDYKGYMPEWYRKAVELLSDIDGDTFPGECFGFYPELNREQRKSILSIYETRRYCDDAETIADVLNVLYDDSFSISTIHGYSQGEWQTVIYKETSKGLLSTLAAYYFGMVTEVHYEDEDGETCWDYIPDDDVWQNEKT